MAKVRIGFSTHFEVENETVGIGTDSALDTLHVTGDITAHNIDAGGGITTVTTYSGFIDKEVILTNPDINLNSKVHSLSGEIIVEGDITVSSGTTITSGPENLTVTDNFTLPGISDDKPTAGTMRFNENLGALEFYTGVEWKAVNSYVDMGNRGRAVFMGGQDSTGNIKVIDYFNMSSKGSAIEFGETLDAESRRSGCSSETRGLSAGSDDNSNHEVIEYITIASEGNSIDFGNMYNGRGTAGGFSSSTRGVWAGGRSPGTSQNTIDYVEIPTLGNAEDFGDMRNARQWVTGCSSPVRGIIAGGEGPAYPSPTRTSDIEYVTIASKGNSVLFGHMTTIAGDVGGFSNSVRGFFAGGEPNNKRKIDMINIASTGNAIHFGDLRHGRIVVNGTASQTRGFIIGGRYEPSAVYVNTIEYVEIASSGNSLDWGDLTAGRWAGASISDSHGGLGGF